MPARFKYDPSLPAFQFINGDGHIVADSRDKILRITDTLVDSVSFPMRFPPLNLDTTTKIGDCNPASSFVFGWARAEYPNGNHYDAPDEDTWFNVGGSWVMMYGGVHANQAANRAMAVYSFYATGGEVFANERVAMNAYTTSTGQSFQWTGVDLHYQLWIGTFD